MLCPLHCRFRYKNPSTAFKTQTSSPSRRAQRRACSFARGGMEGLDSSYRGMVSGEAASKLEQFSRNRQGGVGFPTHQLGSLATILSELDWAR